MPVYIVQVNDGPVKIGFSEDLKARLADISMCSPYELVLLREIDCPIQGEKWLHKKFKDFHIKGEWFNFCPEMLQIIVPSGIRCIKKTRYPKPKKQRVKIDAKVLEKFKDLAKKESRSVMQQIEFILMNNFNDIDETTNPEKQGE